MEYKDEYSYNDRLRVTHIDGHGLNFAPDCH